MYIRAFCWLCLFSVHNRYPHFLPPTWRKEQGKEQIILGPSFVLSERNLLLISVFLRGDSLFWGSKAALTGPSSVWLGGQFPLRTPRQGQAGGRCAGVLQALLLHHPWAVWHSAGAQYASCYVFLWGGVGTSTYSWWGSHARLKYPFVNRSYIAFGKANEISDGKE